MKKFLILSNFILLSVIIFMACNGGPEPGTVKKQPLKDVAGERPDIRDRLRDTVFDKEGGVLDASLAIKMSQDYNNDVSKGYVKGINGRSGVEDATSIWFKLSTIKSFIAKAEEALAGGTYATGLGIRFYYAKYPDDLTGYESLAGMAPVVANRHTLFMVPTFQSKETGDAVDFNYDFITDPNKPLSFNQLLRNNPAAKMKGILGFNRSVIRPDVGVIPNIRNHGGLRPPPAGEDEVFPIGE